MSEFDVLRQAEQVAAAAENRGPRDRIRDLFRWAPRIAEFASNPVQGGTARLAPRGLVTQPMLAAALEDIARAQCTWRWAITTCSVELVIARLDFPAGHRLSLVFGYRRHHELLNDVCADGRLWLTAQPFREGDERALLDLHCLTVDVDELAKALNDSSGYV